MSIFAKSAAVVWRLSAFSTRRAWPWRQIALLGALRSSQVGDRIADRAADGRRQDRLARLEARLGKGNLGS